MNFTNTARKKYATSLIAMYKLGLIDKKLTSNIHRNTLYYWDNKINIENYIGFELDQVWDERKSYIELLMKHNAYFQLCKNMFVLFNCYKYIIFSNKHSKKLLRKHKTDIILAFDYACKSVSKKVISKFIGIPYQRIASWKNVSSCSKSVLNKCLVAHPLQLSNNEISVFKSVLFAEKFALLPLSYRWVQLVRTTKVVICLSTFYKYASAIIGGSYKFVKPVSHTITPKASAPFQVLHMDSTVVKTIDGSRLYIHFIMDNYSKAILSAHASVSARSAVVALNLKSVLEKYGSYKSQIYCDDGPENNGEVNAYLETVAVEKVIATYKHNSTNNLIEAFNKKFKRFIIHGVGFYSLENLSSILPELVDYYNNLYQPSLDRRSPNEVLNGAKLEVLDLEEARRVRRMENKMECCRW